MLGLGEMPRPWIIPPARLCFQASRLKASYLLGAMSAGTGDGAGIQCSGHTLARIAVASLTPGTLPY